ncbi:hypothetical protein DIPPA_16140 [Diplonema papillatum]|nr:hypothetical protein DIPPA_16140 [Diplonema papillatum]|eukprot:gene22896-35092_t
MFGKIPKKVKTMRKRRNEMLRVPLPVVAVLTIVLLVALPAAIGFVVTTNNAEDSVDEVSRKLATATLAAAESKVVHTAFEDPVAQLLSAKSDVERNVTNFRVPEHEVDWGMRMQHWLEKSPVFKSYFALSSSVVHGVEYGNGMFVDAMNKAVVLNEPPNMHVHPFSRDVALSWEATPETTTRMDLSLVPFVSVFSVDRNHEANCRANLPIWMGFSLSMPTAGMGRALVGVLTAPVFRTRAPNPEDLIGVVAVGLYPHLIDLTPHRLSNTSSLVVIDSDRRIVSATDLPELYAPANLSITLSAQVTLSTSGDPLLSSLASSGKLPEDLAARSAGGGYFFDTMSGPGGGTYWINMCTVEHYNLRWHVVMLTPEEYFFDKVEDGNRKTLYLVLIMIAVSCVLAVVLTLVATDDLKKLALAFDKVALIHLEHPAIQQVRTRHIISEYDSLCKGFWHAVEMVTHVQAFLPTVIPRDDCLDSNNESGTSVVSFHQSKSASESNARDSGEERRRSSDRLGQTVGMAGKADRVVTVAGSFAVGLRVSTGVTGLVISVNSFSQACRASCDKASAAHGELFAVIHEIAKRNQGAVSGVDGSRVTVAWNTARPCPPVTSTQHALTVAFELGRTKSPLALTCGVHHASTYHGILGSKFQRFNTIGSDLTDVASHLAQYASCLKILPGVLVSGAVQSVVKGFCLYKADEVQLFSGEPVSVYWVEKPIAANNAEWMYQLREEENSRDLFLDDYFAAVSKRDAPLAGAALRVFAENHPKFHILVQRLRVALDGRFSLTEP